MNTFLNLHFETIHLTQADRQKQLNNIKSFSLTNRIYLRGLCEQSNLHLCPHYNPDQLKRLSKSKPYSLLRRVKIWSISK